MQHHQTYSNKGLLIRIALTAFIYYLTASLSLFFAFGETNSSPIWPATGISLALMVIFGRKVWPGIALGAFVINLDSFYFSMDLPLQQIFLPLVFITLGNTLVVFMCHYLLSKNEIAFIFWQDPKSVLKFILFALISALASSLLGPISMLTAGIITNDVFLIVSYTWWTGDAVGILIFSPLIILWAGKALSFSKRFIWIDFIFLFGSSLIFIALSKIGYFAEPLEESIPIVSIPMLIWMVFRFNIQIASIGVFLVSSVFIILTIYDIGPFVLSETNSSLISLQIYSGIASVTVLLIGAILFERDTTKNTLKEFNEQLEEKVRERTHSLEQEIQSRKVIEDEVRKSNEELTKTNLELDNFVYSTSHDLRAPIASVLGLINLARNETNLVVLSEYLSLGENSLNRLDKFISDILDYSRNSRMEVNKELINFEQIATEVFDNVAFAYNTEKVAMEIKVLNEISFYSDIRRLTVIFNNLITNAVKYHKKVNGSFIKINVVVDSQQVLISIEDNGDGIKEEYLDKVFDMFYRATDKSKGSGIGLYIVKEAVNKMSGTITVESILDKGTTFKIIIPNHQVNNEQ